MTIFDAAVLASPHGNAIVWQTILDSGTDMTSLCAVRLMSGGEYVASVVVLGGTAERLAFGSTRFVAHEWAERIGIRGPGWLICLKECRFLGAEGPHEVHLRPLEIRALITPPLASSRRRVDLVTEHETNFCRS